MTKFTAFVIIVALRIVYQPAGTQHEIAPFASPSSLPSTSISALPPNLIDFSVSLSNNKVMLNWTATGNETVERFEVEKSTDGKNFKMAALVFGTDKPETDSYQFYEKSGGQKVSYRIKLISKNQETAYSKVVEINTGA